MTWIATVFGGFLAALSLCGAGYSVFAAMAARRFMRRPRPCAVAPRPVTLLKPLYQAEPGLRENLESFFVQDYVAPVQIVFGVHDDSDPAIAVVRSLQKKYPQIDSIIVADPARAGASAKVSNLVNMLPSAKHDILVVSDSDIAVPRHWLSVVAGALEESNVGLVTCLYTGKPGAEGVWPVLAAMGTSYDFLPNVVTGVCLGLAQPCMGSTMALSRKTLDGIGGFAAFADYLADDFEIGRAVRGQGLNLAIPALSVAHTAAETSLRALFHQELRWMRTIRCINPFGHLGSIVTHAVPLGLIAAILLGFGPAGLGVLAISLGARLFLKYRIDGIFPTHRGAPWLMPLRDCLSFSVFMTSLFGGTVYWRGSRLSVESNGVISSESLEATP